MTQADYNKKMQSAQKWPLNHKFSITSNRNGVLVCCDFQVYWNGRWCTLGTQNRPFTDESTYVWNEDAEAQIFAEMGRDAAR